MPRKRAVLMSGKGQGEDRRFLAHNMLRIRRCKSCGVEFAATLTQFYCEKCRKDIYRSGNTGERVCVDCGRIFEGGRNAWYCPNCRTVRAQENAREHEKRKRKGLTRKIGDIDYCQKCGRLYMIKNGNQKYCADCGNKTLLEKKCAYSKAHQEQARARREIVRNNSDVCYWCGATYTRKKHTYACSDECAEMLKKYFRKARAYRNGQRKEPPEPPPFMPKTEIPQNVGEKKLPLFSIREKRIAKNLSQKELAEMIGTKQAMISLWERGVFKPPDDKIEALASAFGCSVAELRKRPEE